MGIEFKPCDKLTFSDLLRHPVWTFDLSRAETHPGADETWIRPETFRKRPRSTDVLFLRAQLLTASGTMLDGALLVRFEDGSPMPQALALLHPRYTAIGILDGSVPNWTKRELKRIHPKSAGWFPIAYQAALRVGSGALLFTGQAE